VIEFKDVFGAVNVTKSFLPHFRSNKSGMIIFNGSKCGWSVHPCLPFYQATKFSIEAIAHSLSYEVGYLGIKVLLIEPVSIDSLSKTETWYNLVV
jgi:NADP-dependent 3-hydroxy acid dehydrogenase YdfG